MNEDSVYLCLEKFPTEGNQRQSPTAGDPPAVLAPPAELFAAFTESAPLRLKTLRINEMLYLASGAEASGFIRGVILNTEFSIAGSFFTVTWQAQGSVGYVRQVQAQKVVLVSSESRK